MFDIRPRTASPTRSTPQISRKAGRGRLVALTSDDILYISTMFRNKVVEIETENGREDAFNYIDLGTTFFYLQVGDNMLEYSTENDLNPQSVTISYRKRYLGV